MKRKKLERQQREKVEKKEQKKLEYFNSLPTVKLNPRNNEKIEYIKEYSWKCPNGHGSFTYSKKINDQWGHPHELVFCAICCKYFKFEKEELLQDAN